MLSIVDIKRELGEGLYLYPIHSESIKGNSLDMHASPFAWSLKTSRRLEIRNGHLILPPCDTALIYTEESIYVSHKIGGSYHSKVTLVSKGLGHIGTTLDSQYLGSTLVAVHNHSDKEYSLRVGAEFVTILFHYLTSPDYRDAQTHDNDPGHPRMLEGMEGADEYIEWRDQNKWTVQKNILYNKMIHSEEYMACKRDFETEQIKFNRKLMLDRTKKYVLTLFLALAILGLFAVPSYLVDLGNASRVLTAITEKVVLPLLLAIVSAQVLLDVKGNRNG